MVKPDPVVVVGAGPVGLCLALALAQQDIAVVLIEAMSDCNFLDQVPRAGSNHPTTLEFFDRIGLYEKMETRGLIAPKFHYRERQDNALIAEFVVQENTDLREFLTTNNVRAVDGSLPIPDAPGSAPVLTLVPGGVQASELPDQANLYRRREQDKLFEPRPVAARVKDTAKDATAKVERVTAQRLACGKAFIQLSGEDSTALGFNAHGGQGCISVTSNIAPRLCAEFQTACRKGEWGKANELNDRLMALHEALFCETSPGPVKYAASRLGLCSAELRLPLVPIAEESKRRVDQALASVGLESLAKAAE